MAARFTTALFPQIQLLFPEEGLVYDYKLYDAGLSSAEDDLDEEVIREVKHFQLQAGKSRGRDQEAKQDLVGSSHQGQIKKVYRNQVRMFKVKSSFSLKEEGSFLPSGL